MQSYTSHHDLKQRQPKRSVIQSEQNSTAAPLFSIVIPVYNDWLPLEQCLQALTRQINAPSFEAIVVDDGSA